MKKNSENTNINTNSDQKEEKKKKGLIIFLVILIIALAAALGFMAWQMTHAEPGRTAVIETNPDEELNSAEGTGQVRIKINPVITVKNETMQNLNFCNYNEDRDLQCKIKVGDSYVYTSKKLKSSEILVGDFVKMEKLKDGKNEAIAEVYSFAPGSDELIGQTNVKIELNVEVKLIAFTIDGKSYQAQEEMTWGEWTESPYNTAGLTVGDDDKIEGAKGKTLRDSKGIVTAKKEIKANESYVLKK